MEFTSFAKEILKLTKIDLNNYKEPQMKRRITTLMHRYDILDYRDYLQAIKKNPDMLAAFVDRLTINVTHFFRNPGRWQAFRETILPAVFDTHRKIKIWSAACSTGQEPYTIAIILSELGFSDRASIIATDIDEIALKKAQSGRYKDSTLKGLNSHMLQKYFIKKDHSYHVAPELKKLITFKKHDLLTDSYPAVNIIVCRNVTIYFTEEAKARIYKGFADSLEEDGILFVGSTEQIFNSAQIGLTPIDSFIYQKRTLGTCTKEKTAKR